MNPNIRGAILKAQEAFEQQQARAEEEDAGHKTELAARADVAKTDAWKHVDETLREVIAEHELILKFEKDPCSLYRAQGVAGVLGLVRDSYNFAHAELEASGQ